MTYTKREIARAKAIFAREQRAGKSARMTYAMAVPLNRPWHRTALERFSFIPVHIRTS